MPIHDPAETLRRGKWAEMVALKLWPDLKPVAPGSQRDFNGVDAETPGGGLVQIKNDSGADKTGNLFWEIAKRGGAWNAFGKSTVWHMSPSSAHEYVFVSRAYAYRVSVAELIGAVNRCDIKPRLTPTSFCFLVPVSSLSVFDRKSTP